MSTVSGVFEGTVSVRNSYVVHPVVFWAWMGIFTFIAFTGLIATWLVPWWFEWKLTWQGTFLFFVIACVFSTSGVGFLLSTLEGVIRHFFGISDLHVSVFNLGKELLRKIRDSRKYMGLQ